VAARKEGSTKRHGKRRSDDDDDKDKDDDDQEVKHRRHHGHGHGDKSNNDDNDNDDDDWEDEDDEWDDEDGDDEDEDRDDEDEQGHDGGSHWVEETEDDLIMVGECKGKHLRCGGTVCERCGLLGEKGCCENGDKKRRCCAKGLVLKDGICTCGNEGEPGCIPTTADCGVWEEETMYAGHDMKNIKAKNKSWFASAPITLCCFVFGVAQWLYPTLHAGFRSACMRMLRHVCMLICTVGGLLRTRCVTGALGCRCLRKCKHTPGCTAVTYNPDNNRCLLKKAPLGVKKQHHETTSSFTICPGCDNWEHDTRFVGQELMKLTAEDHWWCLKKCTLNPDCSGAIWNAHKGECSLLALRAHFEKEHAPGLKSILICDRASSSFMCSK
jgi:hypothetical protein